MKKSWISRKYEGELARRVHGTDGDDYFWGLPQADVYRGGAGNDRISGRQDGDRLFGGIGNDTIDGARDNDRLFGGPGYDDLVGGQQLDILTGGSGGDVFYFIAWPGYRGTSDMDIITDFDPRQIGEWISLNINPELKIAEYSQLRDMMIQDGNDVVLSFEGMDILVLKDVRIGQLSDDDFYIEPH